MGLSIHPSVRPFCLFNFGGLDVLISTAWPVLALVYDFNPYMIDRCTNIPTDRQMDTPSYRDVSMQLINSILPAIQTSNTPKLQMDYNSMD